MTATNWSNITSAEQILAIPNNNTSGLFWTGIVWMIFAVIAIAFAGFGLEVALLISGFVCLVASLILAIMGLVSWANFLIFVGLLLFLFIYIIWARKD